MVDVQMSARIDIHNIEDTKLPDPYWLIGQLAFFSFFPAQILRKTRRNNVKKCIYDTLNDLQLGPPHISAMSCDEENLKTFLPGWGHQTMNLYPPSLTLSQSMAKKVWCEDANIKPTFRAVID